MDRPQEIEVVDEHETVERVAAIDVAKASGMICTRVPHPSVAGKRVTKVWEVRATTKALTELADHIVNERVERVVLESTSDPDIAAGSSSVENADSLGPMTPLNS